MSDESIQSKGGNARAQALSAEQRSDIARKAAEARWSLALPKATHTGSVQVGDVEIPCAVLEDGRRVLTQQGFLRALGRTRPSGGKGQSSAIEGLPAFLASDSLKPFISEDLRRSSTHIIFQAAKGGGVGGNRAFGYSADLLPEVCNVYLEARRQGALPLHQRHIADKCELLLRGLARVGIVALVDEATGYQELRDKVALQAILDQFLRKEFAAWAKRFPDEFYREIFRLRKWQWRGMKVNRPQVIAQYTKDLVYSRLIPGILKELETRNPIDEKGHRKSKHHQWLIADVGHPALAQHLYAVIGLMRVADTWEQFKALLDRAYPKRQDTLQLSLFKDDVSIAP